MERHLNVAQYIGIKARKIAEKFKPQPREVREGNLSDAQKAKHLAQSHVIEGTTNQRHQLSSTEISSITMGMERKHPSVEGVSKTTLKKAVEESLRK